MISYQAHLQRVTNAIQRRPTFRSSAIFPVFQLPGISTRICFLGYWLIKRSIAEIHAVVTLRSREGQLLHRTNEIINTPKTYRMELSDLLRQIGIEEQSVFIGSLEIEFFSAHDLFFTYPAVLVNFYGPKFSSVVHTSQRIFNDAEDRNTNMETVVPEAGFTIYADHDREPFFTFINGFDPVHNGKVRMKFYNHKKETLEHELTIAELLPYETSVIYPCNTIDLQAFLDGKPGTAKIEFNVNWVFPRVISGNFQHSLQAMSVTHTYYDCSQAASSGDYWLEAEPGWHPASLMIPLSIQGDRFTHINFYPIHSPSELDIDVELYSLQGELLGQAQNILHLISPSNDMHVLVLKSICHQLDVSPDGVACAKIIVHPSSGSNLPTRIKIGLDYGLKADALPCNICKTMDVFNPQMENKKSSFHWAPILADQEDSIVWLVNSSPMADYRREAEVTLTLYREQDSHKLIRSFLLAPNGSACLRLSEDEELRSFFGGKIGWYTSTSSNPYIATYYLTENRSGIVGGDHDF